MSTTEFRPDDLVVPELSTSMRPLLWRISQQEPRSFWFGSIGFVLFFVTPALSGYLISRGFAALSDGRIGDVYALAISVFAFEAFRMGLIHFCVLQYTRAWVHMQSLPRSNMLAAQLASGGPEAGQPVGSSGEAIPQFREDTDDVTNLIDGIIDLAGGTVFVAIAGFILGAADPRATLILVLPLVAVMLVTRALDSRIKLYRAADREATGHVTSLVGDVMAAATTVKVNGAADTVLAQLRRRVQRRGFTAVRDRVLTEGVLAFGEGASSVGLGLVIIVSAGAIASGSFGVATLALFIAYLGWLHFLPTMIGRVLSRRRHATVALDRMSVLVRDGDVVHVARERSMAIEPWQRAERPQAQRPERITLERFEVVDVTAAYDGKTIVGPVSFTAERGSVTVITGPVGSGKSTLLRALLGLAWAAETTGSVRWNGVELDDRQAFLVPPNAAFLAQVPQLISDSVADNVSLGPIDEGAVERALLTADIADDVAQMPEGLATMIGPRGYRLSGGQRQRLATARALSRLPELVVLDDLSSAVDVETEVRLWDNLAAAGLTVIAVSHRQVAFSRASQIIRLGPDS